MLSMSIKNSAGVDYIFYRRLRAVEDFRAALADMAEKPAPAWKVDALTGTVERAVGQNPVLGNALLPLMLDMMEYAGSDSPGHAR